LTNLIVSDQFQALESEAVLGRFHIVYEKMNSALDGMPYEELGMSDEVMEQVSASSINFHSLITS
jgi:hypothetical protein